MKTNPLIHETVIHEANIPEAKGMPDYTLVIGSCSHLKVCHICPQTYLLGTF